MCGRVQGLQHLRPPWGDLGPEDGSQEGPCDDGRGGGGAKAAPGDRCLPGDDVGPPLYLCPYFAVSPVALFSHSVCPPLGLALAAGISQELSKVRREVDTLSGLDEPLQRRHFTSREKLEAVDIEHRRQIEAIALLRQQKQEL